MRIALWVLLSHWRRHPLQAVLIVLGLALATTLWSAVQAINAEARAAFDQASAQLEQSGEARLVAEDGGPVSIHDYVRLRRAGWPVTPVLEGTVKGPAGSLALVGVDLLSHPISPAAAAATEAQGRAPLAALTASKIGYATPDTAREVIQSDPSWDMIPMSSLPQGYVFTDISLASSLLSMPDQLTYLLILEHEGDHIPPLADLVPELRRSHAPSVVAQGDLTQSFRLNLTAFGFLAFAVGLFIVQGMLTLAVEQRRGMIRTLRQLGVDRRALMSGLLVEVLCFAIGAGALGLVSGYGLAAVLLEDVSATLQGLYGADVPGQLSFRWSWALSGLGMCVIGSTLASLQAFVVLASTADPGGVIARRAARFRRGYAPILLAVGAVLGLLGLALFAFLGGLVGGFGLLAGIMLGIALALPAVITLCLKGLRRISRSVSTDVLLADTRHQLPGLSLALMALLLAISTNIGVGTMVSSFRLTFEEWLNMRLNAEIYIGVQSATDMGRVLDWATQEGRTALSVYRAEATVGEQTVGLRGMAVDAELRRSWPLLRASGTTWSDFEAGRGVMMSEQFAHRSGLQLGDTIAVAPNWSPRIVAIYADYGNPQGEISLALQSLLEHVPSARPSQVALRSPEPARDLIKVKQDIGTATISAIDRNQVYALSLTIFERTFTVTGALKLLTLVVAGFALFTSFLTQWSSRLPQIAPLWAMGMERKRLAGLELARGVLLAAITALTALPLGMVLAWVLLSVINQEAFGWRLPMQIFARDILVTWALSLCVAACASLLPILRLLRIPPDQLLRGFSNDR